MLREIGTCPEQSLLLAAPQRSADGAPRRDPERMNEDDLKQSAIVMATFAWQAAMRDGKIPRPPSH